MYEMSGITFRWLGHDGFQLKKAGKVIYIDVFRLTQTDLEKADVVVCTHEHGDHFRPHRGHSIWRNCQVRNRAFIEFLFRLRLFGVLPFRHRRVAQGGSNGDDRLCGYLLGIPGRRQLAFCPEPPARLPG